MTTVGLDTAFWILMFHQKLWLSVFVPLFITSHWRKLGVLHLSAMPFQKKECLSCGNITCWDSGHAQRRPAWQLRLTWCVIGCNSMGKVIALSFMKWQKKLYSESLYGREHVICFIITGWVNSMRSTEVGLGAEQLKWKPSSLPRPNLSLRNRKKEICGNCSSEIIKMQCMNSTILNLTPANNQSSD